RGSSTTVVSLRWANAYIKAVEILRGPLHRQIRLVSAMGGVISHSLLNLFLIELLQSPGALGRYFLTDLPPVYCCYRRQSAKTAGHKGLIGAIDLKERKILLTTGNPFFPANFNNFTPRYPIH